MFSRFPSMCLLLLVDYFFLSCDSTYFTQKIPAYHASYTTFENSSLPYPYFDFFHFSTVLHFETPKTTLLVKNSNSLEGFRSLAFCHLLHYAKLRIDHSPGGDLHIWRAFAHLIPSIFASNLRNIPIPSLSVPKEEKKIAFLVTFFGIFHPILIQKIRLVFYWIRNLGPAPRFPVLEKIPNFPDFILDFSEPDKVSKSWYGHCSSLQFQ